MPGIRPCWYIRESVCHIKRENRDKEMSRPQLRLWYRYWWWNQWLHLIEEFFHFLWNINVHHSSLANSFMWLTTARHVASIFRPRISLNYSDFVDCIINCAKCSLDFMESEVVHWQSFTYPLSPIMSSLKRWSYSRAISQELLLAVRREARKSFDFFPGQSFWFVFLVIFLRFQKLFLSASHPVQF